MTALFIVIFVDQFLTFSTKIPNILGIAIGIVSLLIFGPKNMLIPSIFMIIIVLILLKTKLEKDMEQNKNKGVK